MDPSRNIPDQDVEDGDTREAYLSVLDDFIDLTAVGDVVSVAEQLVELSNGKLADLCLALWQSLPRPKKSEEPFRFVANSELSGLPYPCGGLGCRSKNLAELAAFSAIYASEVVLFNPFERLINPPPQRSSNVRRARYLSEVAFHISELLLLRPLIDRGMCTFEDEVEERFCQPCFQKALEIILSGRSDDLQGRSMYFDLVERHASNVEVIFEGYERTKARFRITGPEEIVPHQDIMHWISRKKLGEKFDAGQRLSREQVVTFGVGQRFAHYTTSDIVKSSEVCAELGVSNVIASTEHMGVLRSYFGADSFGGAVDVSYPILAGAKIDEIVSFRDNEWHHLHDFRKLVEDGIRSGQDVGALLLDSSANISRILAKSKRQFRRDIAKDIAVGAVGISATVATAGISAAVALAFGALSGGHLAKNVVPKLVDRLVEPEEVRADKGYYAWKVNKKLRH